MRPPGLRHAVAWLGKWGNKVVARQDRRVVITQAPKVSVLKMGEKPFAADGPVIEYRRRRQQLMESQTGE